MYFYAFIIIFNILENVFWMRRSNSKDLKCEFLKSNKNWKLVESIFWKVIWISKYENLKNVS